MSAAADPLAALLASTGLVAHTEDSIVGRDPVIETRFRIGEAAAAALAAGGRAAAELWKLRGGAEQRVRVEVPAACATLLGFAFQRLEAKELPRPSLTNPTVALYRAKDGGWVHLHGGFPHLRDGTLRVLGCDDSADAVARAVARFDAQALEDALADAGLCGARVRSASEWAAHPQGRAVATRPVVEVLRIADADPEPLPARGDGPLGVDRPLSGVRALDLTRVLAGPTCARTLAAYGAEVLRIGAPALPSVPPFVVDTGHGKRSAFLDVRDRAQADRLRDLVRGADVFSQGYRAGALARHGFGAEAVAALRPGIVYVSMNCYGPEGPWSGRPGWEQLAQTVTGIAADEGEPDAPRLIPAAACDYTTGYLAALGVMVALGRRAREGGSWHVRASLCQTATWLYGLGAPGPGAASGLGADVLAPWLVTTDTPFGRLQHLRPVTELSETPARWDLPTVPLGTHPPDWAD